ncbi:MAG: hypothetical protein Q8N05_12250 [Bacteroidota bacterium]|nr:hypothetical protein [Bacteroidota bacterium]
MKDEILKNLDNPKELERLYRENKQRFKLEFNQLYPELTDNQLANFWNERLNYESQEISWGTRRELVFIILGSLLAGVIAKLPAFLNFDPEHFYMRNLGFIFLPVLTTWFILKNQLKLRRIIVTALIMTSGLIFINLLPGNQKTDTLILSCIHLLVLLWLVLGSSFVGENLIAPQKRINFLRYNGDLAVMIAIILIAGAILTGISIGLFSLIGSDISRIYREYVAVFGLAAAPIVGTYLTQTNPQLVSKISPIIARLFTPLVLITLVFFLFAILFSGKDPYNDRDFLMTFNFLLIGVMALILFSVAETSREIKNRASILVLLALSVVTILVNGIAVSAILFRISEWGITPNRLAVLGANLLILTNLILVTIRIFKAATHKSNLLEVENVIARFLPIYGIWAIVVTFLFPFIFGFR